MKISKSTYLGKCVEVIWRDPLGAVREILADAPRGLAALGTWCEYGIVDDITEGVLRIIHSKGRCPGLPERWEVSYTVVPEDLIVSIIILEPMKDTTPSTQISQPSNP